MSGLLHDVKNVKTRVYCIKRIQHVVKKLEEPLDSYKYFITHFDIVINVLKETKTNSGLHIYCIAISKIIPYLDNISENKKQEYKQNIYKYRMMQIKLLKKNTNQ